MTLPTPTPPQPRRTVMSERAKEVCIALAFCAAYGFLLMVEVGCFD